MERPQSIKDRFPGEEFWTEQQYIARVQELEAEVERLREGQSKDLMERWKLHKEVERLREALRRIREEFRNPEGYDDDPVVHLVDDALAGKRACDE